MIKPLDENFRKKLYVDYHLYAARNYNDYAFDSPNDNTVPTQTGLLAYNEPDKFRMLLNFLDVQCQSAHTDDFLLVMAYAKYADRNFDDGILYITKYLEYNPSNIDAWIDLCFFLSHASGGYYAHINMRFHLYHFIHLYHLLDFRTVSKESISILNSVVMNQAPDPSISCSYEKKIHFDTECLILNGKCNNKCLVCPVSDELRDYDFEDRIIKNGFISLAKYIFIKIRKKHTKYFIIKGGEPTLHRSFFKIIRVIGSARPDLLIKVQTNARRFSEQMFMNRQIQSGVSNIVYETLLFSDKAEIHDEITHVPESHKQALQGVENLLNAGNKISFRIYLCEKNIDTLGDTIDTLLSKYGQDPNFMGVDVLLPPPSAQNLVMYFDNSLQQLHEKASIILERYRDPEGPVSFSNEILSSFRPY